MQKSIILTEEQKQQLENHAEKFLPNESCALLFGKIKHDESIVQEIFLVDNIAESPVNFTISNEDLIKGYKIAEEKKLEVIGIFHSHPTSEAYPSNTDKKFMLSNPVVWIIHSGTNKDFKGFVLESELCEVSVQIS